MTTVWFIILSGMLATYVILDGFDFGAGILHLCVAHKDEERRTVLAAIGPLWDGNEVWLLSSGGILVYAFPKAYAAGFSGFYMALMMVLWLLVMRGISIEFRSHQESSLWRSFWDGVFWLSSTLMAIVLGAALGNVIRGVPIGADGYFSGPLFTNFLPGPHPGVLDWYTVLVGLFTLITLAGHGALYLTWKTSGAVQERSKAVAKQTWKLVVVFWILATIGTQIVQPALFATLVSRPATWILALGVLGSLATVFVGMKSGQELKAFLGSCGFLLFLLGATAAGEFPIMLRSTLDPSYTITAFTAAAGGIGPKVGLVWWVVALILVVGYFTFLFRSFRGKVVLDASGRGY